MNTLSSADYLEVWERGLRLHPQDRALLALGAALPQTTCESVADWPLGRRNRALLELCQACFGPNLQGRISCPQCGKDLEFQVEHRALLGQVAEGSGDATIVVKGQSFRLPTTRDLVRVVSEPEPRSAVIQLVESCRTYSSGCATWQDEELEEIGERMASADPLAEIRLKYDCAECGHQWGESLDIVAFLWLEIEARAKRLLMEIHTLATAYGWSEKEILSLSEPRRRLYLEMVRA
jgi:hypothetical protein